MTVLGACSSDSRRRAAGTQHRHAGARNSFRPLPRAAGFARALDRDVALSPTRVQKDQVVAKVGSHRSVDSAGLLVEDHAVEFHHHLPTRKVPEVAATRAAGARGVLGGELCEELFVVAYLALPLSDAL